MKRRKQQLQARLKLASLPLTPKDNSPAPAATTGAAAATAVEPPKAPVAQSAPKAAAPQPAAAASPASPAAKAASPNASGKSPRTQLAALVVPTDTAAHLPPLRTTSSPVTTSPNHSTRHLQPASPRSAGTSPSHLEQPYHNRRRPSHDINLYSPLTPVPAPSFGQYLTLQLHLGISSHFPASGHASQHAQELQ